jgi:hypothetical protein
MKRLLFVLILVLVALPSAGQTPVPSPTPPATLLSWDHDGVNTDGYALAVDGVRSVVTATCAVVASVRSCTVPFPALTPGQHTLIVSAYNVAGESAADPFLVNVVVKPLKPVNIRIK